MQMSYQLGPLRDIARLLRGILRPSEADPFVQQNPRALGAHDTLFLWESIHEATLPTGFTGYTPYQSPEPLLMQHLPADAGRRTFEHLMQMAPVRIDAITKLLTALGHEVQPTAQSWQSIAEFLIEHITPSDVTAQALKITTPSDSMGWLALRSERLVAPLWHSISVDLALLMAAQAMQHHPALEWRFWADSGFEEPEAFGRSPWLQDTSISGDKPVRTLLFEMIAVNMGNALESRLKGAAVRWMCPWTISISH